MIREQDNAVMGAPEFSGSNIAVDLTRPDSVEIRITPNRGEPRSSAPFAGPASSVSTSSYERDAQRPWGVQVIDHWLETRAGRFASRLRLPSVLLGRHHPSGVRRGLLQAIYRLLDLGFASLYLAVLSPLMLLAAIAIKLDSPGPVFYRHPRYGRGGKKIGVWKFRSMVVDADQLIDEARQAVSESNGATVDAPTFKSADDPRVTSVGRFLRRTGIDELPQLFNVIVGQMSLVGPRPLVAEEVAMLTSEAAELRHSVRPGITCLWQVIRKEETTFFERMHLDLFYVRHRSWRLDVAIVAMTPLALLQGRGAY